MGANSEESSKQYSPREVFVRGVLMGLAELAFEASEPLEPEMEEST